MKNNTSVSEWLDITALIRSKELNVRYGNDPFTDTHIETLLEFYKDSSIRGQVITIWYLTYLINNF